MKPYKSYSVTHSNIAFCFSSFMIINPLLNTNCPAGLFLPVKCSYLLLMSYFNYYGSSASNEYFASNACNAY